MHRGHTGTALLCNFQIGKIAHAPHARTQKDSRTHHSTIFVGESAINMTRCASSIRCHLKSRRIKFNENTFKICQRRDCVRVVCKTGCVPDKSVAAFECSFKNYYFIIGRCGHSDFFPIVHIMSFGLQAYC